MGALIISQCLFGFRTRLGIVVEQGEETADSTSGIRVLKFGKVMEKYEKVDIEPFYCIVESEKM